MKRQKITLHLLDQNLQTRTACLSACLVAKVLGWINEMGGLARHVIHVIIHCINTVSKQNEQLAKQWITEDLTKET